MLEKKEVGKIFWSSTSIDISLNGVWNKWCCNSLAKLHHLHIVSLSELCDAMSTKSRKVHHLDCKNRSEKRTCTSNSEVYSHKWITIFYIWFQSVVWELLHKSRAFME
jgi:hypothetical protein